MRKIFFALLAVLYALGAHGLNLVSNGGFETDSATDWTLLNQGVITSYSIHYTKLYEVKTLQLRQIS